MRFLAKMSANWSSNLFVSNAARCRFHLVLCSQRNICKFSWYYFFYLLYGCMWKPTTIQQLREQVSASYRANPNNSFVITPFVFFAIQFVIYWTKGFRHEGLGLACADIFFKADQVYLWMMTFFLTRVKSMSCCEKSCLLDQHSYSIFTKNYCTNKYLNSISLVKNY